MGVQFFTPPATLTAGISSPILPVRTTALFNNIQNTTVSAGTVVDNLAGATGFAGVASTTLSFNTDGYFEWSFGLINGDDFSGIANNPNSVGFGTIDFAIYYDGSGAIGVYYQTTRVTNLATQSTSDIWRIQIISGVANVMRNGVSVYTYAQAPTFPLYGKTGLTHGTTSKITNAFITVVPTGAKNGDLYVNTLSGDVYQFQNAVWGVPLGNFKNYPQVDNGTLAATASISLNYNLNQKVTLGANCTLTLTNPVAGALYSIKILQDAIGSRTLTYSPAIKWPGGTPPVLTTAANATDIITLYYDGVNYYGRSNLAYA